MQTPSSREWSGEDKALIGKPDYERSGILLSSPLLSHTSTNQSLSTSSTLPKLRSKQIIFFRCQQRSESGSTQGSPPRFADPAVIEAQLSPEYAGMA
jgi:hypothetical protein